MYNETGGLVNNTVRAIVMIYENLKSHLTIKGRINRTEFIAYSLIYNLLLLIVALPLQFAPENIFIFVGYPISIIFNILIAMLVIKRVHDYDESAWYALYYLVPIVNLFVVFSPGNLHPNKFGEVPQQPSLHLKLSIVITIIFTIVLVNMYMNL